MKSYSFKKQFFPLIVVIVSLIVFGGFFFLYSVGLLSSKNNELKAILDWKPQSESIVFDRHGEVVGALYNRHHIYISFDEIPQGMIEAIISIEDKNFWEHPGFDWLAIARTVAKNIRYPSRRLKGASTITQQLVKNFVSSQERSFTRKLKEIVLAHRLEQILSKEKILEIYLNSLFLGNGSYGVGSAAKRYFNKDLRELGRAEFALLAGLYQAPTSLNPFKNREGAKLRQKAVLRSLVLNGFILKKDYYKIVAEELHYRPYKNNKKAPYFVTHIMKEAAKLLGESTVKNKGLKIFTTLDYKLQEKAEESIQKAGPFLDSLARETDEIAQKKSTSLEELKKTNLEAALLSSDLHTGEILTMVGGRSFEESQFNRTTQAYRQPGSVFKPIIYSFALHSGYRWSEVKYIAPLNFTGDYKPRSSEKEYVSETTLLRALYQSINSVSLELGNELGLLPILSYAKTLGMNSELKEELGTLIGSSETTLLDLLKVYSVFGNGGFRADLYSIEKIMDFDGKVLYEHLLKNRERILPKEHSLLMTKGLQSVLKYGTAKEAESLVDFAAGKTGTSNDSKDNWFCGYTSKTATVVWVGSDDYKPLPEKVSGGTAALPIWMDYVNIEKEYLNLEPLEDPTILVKRRIHPKYGYDAEDGVDMWFERTNLPEDKKPSYDILSEANLYRVY